jgi:hypothetical protein
MKITKRRLRRIIKEEKARLLNEEYPLGGGKGPPSWQLFEQAAWDAAAEMIEAGAEPGNVRLAMIETLAEILHEIEEDAVWHPDRAGPIE